MWKVVTLAMLSLCHVNALESNLCQETPKEKHCLIEYSVRDRWPHQVRYVYNWYTKSCFEIRWSDNCHAVPSPTTTNNFLTYQECLDQCGGWA
ncbi:uncharacterized protein LOC110377544 [Helicoverpa armigera]|uniref:uncharacterized protein LOC110377544 n=1 Tax=Helicoverpa armigera TaxID=29058 RepID=UPI003083195A